MSQNAQFAAKNESDAQPDANTEGRQKAQEDRREELLADLDKLAAEIPTPKTRRDYESRLLCLIARVHGLCARDGAAVMLDPGADNRALSHATQRLRVAGLKSPAVPTTTKRPAFSKEGTTRRRIARKSGNR